MENNKTAWDYFKVSGSLDTLIFICWLLMGVSSWYYYKKRKLIALQSIPPNDRRYLSRATPRYQYIAIIGIIVETFQICSFAFYPAVVWSDTVRNLTDWMQYMTLNVDGHFTVVYWGSLFFAVFTVMFIVVRRAVLKSRINSEYYRELFSGWRYSTYILIEILVVYFSLPIFSVFISTTNCEYFDDRSPAFNEIKYITCWTDGRHYIYLIPGLTCLLFYYITVLFGSNSVSELVNKNYVQTGGFMIISIQVKVFIALFGGYLDTQHLDWEFTFTMLLLIMISSLVLTLYPNSTYKLKTLNHVQLFSVSICTWIYICAILTSTRHRFNLSLDLPASLLLIGLIIILVIGLVSLFIRYHFFTTDDSSLISLNQPIEELIKE